MVKVGDVAPDFTMKNENNEDVTLSKIIGNKFIIIYFYPKDFTSGCTKEVNLPKF